MSDKKVTFRKTVKRFFGPIKERPRMYVRGAFAPFLWGIFPGITILLLQQFIQSLETNTYTMAGYMIILYIIAMVFRFGCGWFMKHRNRAEQYFKFMDILQKIRYQKFYNLDNNQIEILGTGKFINIIEKGFSMRTKSLIDIEKRVMVITVDFLFTCYIIRINGGGELVGIFIVFFFIIQFVVVTFNKKALQLRKKRRELETDATKQQVKMIMTKMETVQNRKVFGEIQKLSCIFGQANDANLALNSKLWFVFNVGLMAMWLLMIGAMIFALYTKQGGLISFTSITVLFLAISRIQSVIFPAVDFFKQFTDDFINIQKLRDTFDAIKTIETDVGQEFQYTSGHISLQNIAFSYDNKPVFTNLSLDIKGCKKTAFVGESGGGKTTLIKLLAGYIRPDAGEIIIDGQKLSEISLQSYYKHIGYLTQEPSVFDGTIRENLVYALDYEPRQEVVEKIVKLAKCEFVFDFENTFQTEIGERGVRLSGGQKQRLAIAKIMLKSPNIILLDEPTSALDSFNEELVSQALMNLFQGRTVIVIAHRLQTVKNADIIHYIDAGQIVESGSHDELVAKSGKYKRMLDLQSGF